MSDTGMTNTRTAPIEYGGRSALALLQPSIPPRHPDAPVLRSPQPVISTDPAMHCTGFVNPVCDGTVRTA